MEDEPDYPPDPALDLLMILIAELHRDQVLDNANLASMRRRLELSGLPELAERVQMIPLSNAIDTPAKNRASLHVVDGGNGDD